MPPPTSLDSQALSQIDQAFKTFYNAVSQDDARVFNSTQLGDVRAAALDVQRRLAAKQSSRNLRRLQPLLEGITHYSGAVEVLCNGTPYLPWIWAPIKLCLQVACDHLGAFEKLIKAYAAIAEALPRFDILAVALKDHPDFQQVLATVYCDILEFHRRAYRVFRASSWARFFDSSWARFDFCFAAILDDLKRHADLVDKEANAFSMLSLQQLRQQCVDDVAKREQQALDKQFESTLAWLDVREYDQEDRIRNLSARCHPGTSDWLFDHVRYCKWRSGSSASALLWVHGIPGSGMCCEAHAWRARLMGLLLGKSVLAAQVVKCLQTNDSCTVAYHVYSHHGDENDRAGTVLRSLTRQVVRQRRDFASLIYGDYLLKGREASTHTLRELIVTLASGMSDLCVVVDGLNECEDAEMRDTLLTLTTLSAKKQAAVNSCKVLVFSTDIPNIGKAFKKAPSISLNAEKAAIDNAIRIFIHDKFEELRLDRDDSQAFEGLFTDLEQQMIAKAQGL